MSSCAMTPSRSRPCVCEGSTQMRPATISIVHGTAGFPVGAIVYRGSASPISSSIGGMASVGHSSCGVTLLKSTWDCRFRQEGHTAHEQRYCGFAGDASTSFGPPHGSGAPRTGVGAFARPRHPGAVMDPRRNRREVRTARVGTASVGTRPAPPSYRYSGDPLRGGPSGISAGLSALKMPQRIPVLP